MVLPLDQNMLRQLVKGSDGGKKCIDIYKFKG